MDHVGDEAGARDGVGTDSMSITCRLHGTTGVVVIAGDLDLVGGDALEAAVAGLVGDGVVDVSVQAEGVSFIDSSGLGGLLAARAMVVEAGGELRFGPMTEAVARIIDLAGVSDLLGPASV